MNKYTIEDIQEAYKKFKSYVYYDNSNLHMRQQIAEFESTDYKKRLQILHENLDHLNIIGEFYNDMNTYFTDLVKSISYWKFPKKIYTKNNSNDQLLRNYQYDKRIEVTDYIYHVNSPIELHIVAVLWIMKEGQYLVEDTEFSYGYTLDKTDNKKDIVSGLRLFKPYYSEYQKWRDRAINSAKNILTENQNVGIISLDLKNFYHSVKLDFGLIKIFLENKGINSTLTKILHKIYSHYTLETHSLNHKEFNDKSILPIGFLSSGILANWHLKKFDSKINNMLSPVYYGRYVDDILITLPLGSLKKFPNSKKLIEIIFEDNNILEKDLLNINREDQENDSDTIYKVLDYSSLYIQNEKIIIMLFDKNEPTAILDKFKNEIRKSSSEYKFLPSEELINENFEEASSKLIYDGSKNKLRSIKEFQDDRFGISSFLAKKIFLALQSDITVDTEASEQILDFFRNSRCLDYTSLWEKVFTYFVLNNDYFSIERFAKNIRYAVSLLPDSENGEVKDNYEATLSSVISLSISIKLEAYKRKEVFFIYIELAEKYRNARMVRKNYSKSVLAELVNIKYKKYIDLTDQSVSIDPNFLTKYKYYPRYVHYHEIVLASFISKIINGSLEATNITDIISKSQAIFNAVSNSSVETLSYMPIPKKIDGIPTFCLQENICKKKLKIGIANFNIENKIFTQSYIRNPVISPNRKKELIKILNQAIVEKVDLIVLPECSIPFSWLHWIVNFAHTKQIGIIFGMEHYISKNNKAYNLIVSLLPVKLKKYTSLAIDIRVKKYYSPEEERILKGYGYQIPVNKNNQTIYNWQNIHFTAFNCFELANIHDRAKYKSKVDLVVASEYNRDTTYFSNIVESSARDLHCYFVQSNSAHYGDNRIYQPSSSNYSDILKIKGGENSTLLVGTINIEKLRDFQNKEYELQKDDNSFKPTPPDYDRNELRKRIVSCEKLS